MATGIQDYIDYVFHNGRSGTGEHCFAVKSCFPDMGELDKTVVLFGVTENSKQILNLVTLYPKTRDPQVRKNHVKVSFVNPQVAKQAISEARKLGIKILTPEDKKSLEEVDFSSVPEGKVFKANSKYRIYYGRLGDKILVLFQQNGKAHGEYDATFRIRSLSLKGVLLEEELLSGKQTSDGSTYYTTEYSIARPIFESRLGIKRKNPCSVSFHLSEDGKLVVEKPVAQKKIYPASLADCFGV